MTGGDLDLFGEILGGGSYEDLALRTERVTIHGFPWSVVDLPTLIELKRAAGRPRGLEVLAELHALLGEGDVEDA